MREHRSSITVRGGAGHRRSLRSRFIRGAFVVRPIATELYALKHYDITVADDPKRLIVTVRNGKTGFRSSNTMPGAVSVYERIRRRYLNAKGEDYIFLPQYLNRQTAAKIVQRQFHILLSQAGLRSRQLRQAPRLLQMPESPDLPTTVADMWIGSGRAHP